MTANLYTLFLFAISLSTLNCPSGISASSTSSTSELELDCSVSSLDSYKIIAIHINYMHAIKLIRQTGSSWSYDSYM